ncbi:hypothetical protein L484_025347 [Morus notabilis]|uniref:Uncharacterized protein n=1 Tax=Morus notabilis TaxID=981085 RepID=W9RQN0_9ROSA|nr:hypothetical protein L484_025347 [Morus notabilis]
MIAALTTQGRREPIDRQSGLQDDQQEGDDSDSGQSEADVDRQPPNHADLVARHPGGQNGRICLPGHSSPSTQPWVVDGRSRTTQFWVIDDGTWTGTPRFARVRA